LFTTSLHGLTTSTEQCARLETAEETLPSSKRSMPLVPLAPTKIQSAPHVWASSRISSVGLPRLIKTSARNPALRILCAAGSKISRTWFQLLSSATSIHFMADGSEGLEVSGITVSTTANRPTSVPLGQLRLHTSSTAAFESAELSTPISSRTGLSGLLSTARPIRTEQRAS